MTRVAAIDCGTNSIRLLVADLDGSAKADVERVMRIVRLGEGVDQTGLLSPGALQRTAEALDEFADICERLGVERARMVATSATRDADNSSDFVALVEQRLQLTPDVISGDQEAALSFLGATTGLNEPGPYLVIDIGGGSTELVFGTSEVDAAYSMDIGCVRLTERHLHSDPPTTEELAQVERDILEAGNLGLPAVPHDRAVTVIGLAGSVTTVAALALGLPGYDPVAIHHSRVSRQAVTGVTQLLMTMTREQRAALPVMHPGRVDVIVAGALVLSGLMSRMRVDELLVSETDILDGIALSIR